MMLQDERAAYNIGRYAVEKTSMGYAQSILVKAFWSVEKALRHAQKINDKWNRSKRVELVEIHRNRATVRLHWDGRMALSKDLCLINQGTYTYLPLVWGGKPFALKENSCFFEGAPYCEYQLKWPAQNRLHAISSRFFTSKSVLKETIREMENDKRIIELKYEEVNRLNTELNQKIKQLTAIQDTGKAILSVLDIDRLLTVIMNLIANVCHINRAIIMLVNEEDRCLEYLHGTIKDGEVPPEIRDYRVSLDRISNILVRVTNTGRPEYIPQVDHSRLRKENIVLTHGRPSSVFVVPLITRSKVIGVIATDGIDGKGVPDETRATLEVFSPQIAIAIENARLYGRLQEQMTELQRSHALLSRAERFSFLGNLAARLAHEIKNPLTAIRTFLQMLPRKYDDKEFREEFYKIALEETMRVNNLITELLDLVKHKESNFTFSDLQVLIDKMALLISPQTNEKRIEVLRRYDSDVGQLWLDPEKIKQVILNILANAVDFTPQGGRIEITTQKEEVKKGEQEVKILIKNTGAAIDKDIIDKIFDPYFTTKHRSDLHNGTGLGLFIAHQNMADHHGSIEVESQEGGTTFILKLPFQPVETTLAERRDRNDAH
jgi:signal transduction histidine kinase